MRVLSTSHYPMSLRHITPEYLTYQQAATYMGISLSTIKKLVRPGWRYVRDASGAVVRDASGKRLRELTGQRPVLTVYEIRGLDTPRLRRADCEALMRPRPVAPRTLPREGKPSKKLNTKLRANAQSATSTEVPDGPSVK